MSKMYLGAAMVLLVWLAPGIQAQGQAQPHSAVELQSAPLQVTLPSMVNLTVTVRLGFLVCQDDFTVPVTLGYAFEGMSAIPALAGPTSLDVPFTRDIISVNYPYNYVGRATAQLSIPNVATLRDQNGTLIATVQYGGTTPGQCQTSGPIPSASNQTSVGLVVLGPHGASGTSSHLSQSNALDGSDAPTSPTKNSPGTGLAAVVLLIALAVTVRRHS